MRFFFQPPSKKIGAENFEKPFKTVGVCFQRQDFTIPSRLMYSLECVPNEHESPILDVSFPQNCNLSIDIVDWKGQKSPPYQEARLEESGKNLGSLRSFLSLFLNPWSGLEEKEVGAGGKGG